MGAFCVFGISKTLCRAKAEKKTPTIIGGKRLSVEEWGMEVTIQSASLFLTMDKPVKISPEFDAPQFCRDWVRVNPSEVRMARIMVRTEKRDKDGNVVMRKGAPVMTWGDFDLGTILLDKANDIAQVV